MVVILSEIFRLSLLWASATSCTVIHLYFIIFYFISILLSFVFYFGYLPTLFYHVISHFFLRLSSLSTHFKHTWFVVFLAMSSSFFILFLCFILSLPHIITFQKAIVLSPFFGDVGNPAVGPVVYVVRQKTCVVTEALWEGCDICDRA